MNLYTVLVTLLNVIAVLIGAGSGTISIFDGMRIVLLLLPALLYRRESIEYCYCTVSVLVMLLCRTLLLIGTRSYVVEDMIYEAYQTNAIYIDIAVSLLYFIFLYYYTVHRTVKYFEGTSMNKFRDSMRVAVNNYLYITFVGRALYTFSAYPFYHEYLNVPHSIAAVVVYSFIYYLTIKKFSDIVLKNTGK